MWFVIYSALRRFCHIAKARHFWPVMALLTASFGAVLILLAIMTHAQDQLQSTREEQALQSAVLSLKASLRHDLQDYAKWDDAVRHISTNFAPIWIDDNVVAYLGRLQGYEHITAYAQTATGRVPLATMPGQQNDGVPWTPYLGRKDAALPRLAADLALPGPGAELLLEYRPAHTRTLHIVGEFTAANPGAAGAAISFSGNDGHVSLIQQAPHSLFDRQVQAQADRNLTFSMWRLLATTLARAR